MVKRASRLAAQSAMEYLMTYGWAILIIAVALAALFELGVFNGSNLSPQGCIAQAGFTCTNLVYTANGIALTLGQTTGKYYYGNWVFVASQGESLNARGVPVNFTCTATGCANAVTVGLQGPNGIRVLAPGQTITAVFPSNEFASGSIPPYTSTTPATGLAVGTPFAGYVWLGYCPNPCQSPTAFSKVATLTVKSSGANLQGVGSSPSGSPGPSVLYSVPITLSLSPSAPSSTPTNFQQNLTIHSSNYQSYLNGGWSNAEFTTGPSATGTLLQAWIESNPSNTATTTPVWVNLGSDTISPGGSITIYMNFMSTNVMSASGPTGEAPQLSTPYAQNDNGARVFASYWNFAGVSSSPPSGWQASANTVVSMNNGISMTFGCCSGGGYLVTTSTFNLGTELLTDLTTSPQTSTGYIALSQPMGYYGGQGWAGTYVRNACAGSYPDQANPTNGEDNGCGGTFGYLSTPGNSGIYSIDPISASESIQLFNHGLGSTTQPVSGDAPIYPDNVGYACMLPSGGQCGSMSAQWAAVLNAPPGGFVPTQTGG